MKRNLSSMSWDQLTQWSGDEERDHLDYLACETEFLRREVLYQRETSVAARETAKFTRYNAKYMLWSAITLSVSAFLQAFTLIISVLLRLHGV